MGKGSESTAINGYKVPTNPACHGLALKSIQSPAWKHWELVDLATRSHVEFAAIINEGDFPGVRLRGKVAKPGADLKFNQS